MEQLFLHHFGSFQAKLSEIWFHLEEFFLAESQLQA